MSERCERTDLLVDQCAHCQGHDQKPQVAAGMRTSRPFTASFGSPCGGSDDIKPGDQIVMYAREAWHVECAETDGAVVPRSEPSRRRRRSEDPYG